MKGNRLIILISSILLLTICSGLLFYKNLFLFESVSFNGKVNFEEIRYTDLQINATAAISRLNLSTDPTQLEAEVNRLNELMYIVTDVKKITPELTSSVAKIKIHFKNKISKLNEFQTALKELKVALDSLNPAYNDLINNKIKFTIDNRDFYRESLIDALFYVSNSNKDNEDRLNDDKKVLSQIISFAKTPNPRILKFNAYIDIILTRTKQIDQLAKDFYSDSSINKELVIVGNYYKNSEKSKAKDAEIFLSMIIGAIVLYIFSIIIIFKKFN